ncbi:MAG: hypothetical protein ACLUD2_14400 [Clostridium sp.]
MLPQLEGKSGALYLDTHDETKTKSMYTFRPKGIVFWAYCKKNG